MWTYEGNQKYFDFRMAKFHEMDEKLRFMDVICIAYFLKIFQLFYVI